ncbi:MAG TPA: hypothetical protein QF646_03345, partial [Candidatus Poseidoniales archaeon]|nr:hypothetical protein [Candidatus Poseidoniales archaeon]
SSNAHDPGQTITYEVVRIADIATGNQGDAAILVEQGELGSFDETARDNIANEWVNTIWPDISDVFQLSSSIRDSDNNCQIQIVLTPMDGGGGMGGYFWGAWEGTREAIFVDIVDVKTNFGNFILSHELQHFLLFQEDIDEVTWLNEGLADLAGWLSYKNQSTFVSDHFNHWMDHPEYGPLAWLDGRTDENDALIYSDYGFGAAMNLYLWDTFDDSITTDIFQSPSNGIASVALCVEWIDCDDEGTKRSSAIGSTWNDIMANFTASSLIDDGSFSYAAIDFQNDCAHAEEYCSLKVSEQGDDWSGSPPLFITAGDDTDIDDDGIPNDVDNDIDGDGQVNSGDNDDDGDGLLDIDDPDDVNNGQWSVESWGVRAFHLSSFPGDSDLNLNITTGDSDWQVRLLVNDTTTGWELRPVTFPVLESQRSLTTVNGVGSSIDQLYVIGWYAATDPTDTPNESERRCDASWSDVAGYVGVWDEATIYSQGQNVVYNDLLYIAIKEVPAGIVPTSLNTAYWTRNSAPVVYNKQGCTMGESWIKVTAALSTDPPSLALTSVPVLSDGDGDTQADTMLVNVRITTDAFESSVGLIIEVKDATTDAIIDSLSTQETPMASQSFDQNYYFTAKADGDYLVRAAIFGQDGTLIMDESSDSVTLSNMKPLVSGSVSGIDSSNIPDSQAIAKTFCASAVTACVETWADLTYNTDLANSGDAWGLRTNPSTYPHLDEPSSYLWNFGDGNQSILRAGAFAYRSSTPLPSSNTVTLNVTDSGGAVSDLGIGSQFLVSVIDVTTPFPRIFVGSTEILTDYYVRSEQRVRFDAERTSDNVPSEYLQFSWDWGDGNSSSSSDSQNCDVSNCMRVVHTWPDGSADGQQYVLTLTVSDGTQQRQVTRNIFVLNRPPSVLPVDSFRISTLSQLPLSPPFEDIDGQITQVSWQFENTGEECTS